MKRLLNMLYVTTQGSYLHRDGETVLIINKDKIKLRVPIHNLQGIICFGQVSMSPPLMGLCAERNVGVSFLSYSGRFLARVQGNVSGNVLLRRAQYRFADNTEKCSEIARSIVVAKINNCRVVLQRAVREHHNNNNSSLMLEIINKLAKLIKQLQDINKLDSIRGIEGEAAQQYYSVFDHLIVAQKNDFFFKERNRRPPLDNTNALLSFLYTILTHDVSSALETVGLDPTVGFLHRDKPGRPGLALDLMEEFRPYLVDRLALSLINLKQISGNGFIRTESGAVIMDDETRKNVITAYQNRKLDEITHSFLNEKIAIGLLPYAQSLLLSRFLRGDIEGYPPFIWR